MATPPPLVLVHGLWDSPQVFDRLAALLQRRQPKLELLIPHLRHGLGHVPLRQLAARLDQQIQARFPANTRLDLLGFSMGGLIARLWLQDWGGHRRTRRFLCLGSPQQGTLLAQLMPPQLLAGIADMKVGSPLLRDLQRRSDRLTDVRCLSFYTPTDLMVIPGWRAVLPSGDRQALPVWTHRQLIRDTRALDLVADVLLASDTDLDGRQGP